MRALVIYCHPRARSFTAAVRDLVLERLERAGAEIRLRDLYAEGFDPLLTAAELDGYEDTATNTHASRPGRGRPALVRHADLRLSDLVVRVAGDAEGLARPGACARRGLSDAGRERRYQARR